VVDGDRLGGEDRRVPVRHAGDEQPEPGAAGHAAQRGEGRVALEALARTRPVHGLEVVEPPDPVEAGLVGQLGPRHHLGPGHALLGDVETDPHGGLLRFPPDGRAV